jgi:hypothetical protein
MTLYLPTFEELYGPPVPLASGQRQSLDAYRGKLPDSIVDLWHASGRCQFGDGLLRLVHPQKFTPVLEAFGFDPTRQFVFLMNAFGNFFVYDDEHITHVNAKYGWALRYGNDIELFFEVLLADSQYFKSVMWGQKYIEVQRRLGALSEYEMYGYVPALVLGGADEDRFLVRVEAVEHLVLLGQLTTLAFR